MLTQNPSKPVIAQEPKNDAELGVEKLDTTVTPSKKGSKFWLIFTSMCICIFLSGLDISSVSTALPTIANTLHPSQFAWVGSAYSLSSTAFLPLSSGLAQTFGRRPSMLLSLALLALGSGICGAANSMAMLIAGRTIQGLGGGGIQSLTGIILSDLVTLKERGLYSGLYGIAWCVAAVTGPVLGGSLAAQNQWRWLFYFNLPICLVACVAVVMLLDLPIPSGGLREKFMRMDWIGTFLVISGTTSHTIALTWGGVTSPWSSATVIVPLVLGLVGLGVFIVYDARLATHPLIPFSIMTNRTSLSGYLQIFCFSIPTFTTIYYYPVYFQACKGLSPTMSGVCSLAYGSLCLMATAAGFSIRITSRYRPQIWMGWVITIISLGLLSTISVTDSLEKSVGYLFFLGCGVGLLNATPQYPIQASLPVTQSAPAQAFGWFVRSFATVWGITIGGTVLQNELAKKLPASFMQSVPQGTPGEYSLIPDLSTLPPQMLLEVQVAFANSLAVLWRVLVAISGVGFVTSWFMKGLPLHDTLDKDWAMKNESRSVVKA